ncbi:MAG: hypothetical protein AB4290_14280 [Spirulina sp.]
MKNTNKQIHQDKNQIKKEKHLQLQKLKLEQLEGVAGSGIWPGTG